MNTITHSFTAPVIKFYDRVAGRRWPRYLIEVEKTAILSAAFTAPRPPDHALDIGCGTGLWSQYLARMGWGITGIETDREALDVCRAKMPQSRFRTTEPTATSLPAESSAYNLALAIEVYPVMEAAWFPAELRRVLRPGGLFVGVHLNRASWRGLAVRLKYWITRDPKAAVNYVSSYSGWRAKMKAAGFAVVSEEGFCWFPFKRDSNSRLVPVACWLERALGLHRIVSLSPWIIVTLRKASAEAWVCAEVSP